MHPLHRLNLHPDPLNAAEADAPEVLVEAGDLASCLADLNVDSAGHVLAGATEIVLLPSNAIVVVKLPLIGRFEIAGGTATFLLKRVL